MVYNVRHFVFIYIIIIVNYLSHTFAPWTEVIVPPATGTMNVCEHWLQYHGFRSNNIQNRRWANGRVKNYDQDVFYYAAAYAYSLTNTSELYDVNSFGPSDFCNMHTINFVNYPYIALKDAEFTCEGWIDLYLYDKDRHEINQKSSNNYLDEYIERKKRSKKRAKILRREKYGQTSTRGMRFDTDSDEERDPYLYKPSKQLDYWKWAGQRDREMDTKISLWAARYFQYIMDNSDTTPRQFCVLMGQTVLNRPLPNKYPFMSLNESRMSCAEWQDVRGYPMMSENVLVEDNCTNVTKLPFITLASKMSCYEWIKLSGFSDNNSDNFQKIVSRSIDTYIVNAMAKNYINYVREQRNVNLDRRNQLQEQYHYIADLIENENEVLNISNLMDHQNFVKNELESVNNFVEFLIKPKELCENRGFPEAVKMDYFGNF